MKEKAFKMHEKSLKKAYKLLGVSTPRELSDRFLEEDQKIIKLGISDYHDPKLLTNKLRHVLENINARYLSKEERHERRLILWLWYHHAISYAVWGYKDMGCAQTYSSLALKYQPKNHPNHITRLLYLLVRNRSSEASEWIGEIRNNAEKKTARMLLNLYNKGGFS